MNLKLTSTKVFKQTLDNANARIIAHQGGARSSKTFSICQYLILKALSEGPYTVTIARSRFTWLKNTAMADFFEVLKSSGLYNPTNHNKTEHTYTLNESVFAFMGLDESQKLRGRKQDYFWINEANECSLDDFRQAALRTQGQVIIDYNPSDEHHWIYDHVLSRPDCKLIKSTYRDNPFLPRELVKEIESLKGTDEQYWQVFGLGKRGRSKELVFPNYELFNGLPPEGCKRAYGLDFGYNHPTVLVQVDYKDGALYWTERIYRSYLTPADLIDLMRQQGIDKRSEIHADSAEPLYISELQRAGFNVRTAQKNITAGIRQIKSNRLFINARSANLIKEINNYKWLKTSSGQIVDEPVKFLDDAMDAARYASFVLSRNPHSGLKFTLVKNKYHQ